tara:strand:- start:13856 stop:14416 length:561 start_codon:yes stop_codon:yes gene_type:complete
MGEIIVNGNGIPHQATVDEFGNIFTSSVNEPTDKNANRLGNVWSIYFTTTPVGAGDYFFYMKNTTDVVWAISDIRIMCASADTFNYNLVSGTPSYTSGTDITPTPRNTAFTHVPTGTIKKDTDTTGLTNNGTVFFERCDTANKRYKLSTSANILITQNKAFAIEAVTGTALVTCVLSLAVLADRSK